MSTTGPKGPTDASAMARVLQFRRPDATTQTTSPATVQDAASVKEAAREPGETTPAPAAVFESTPGQGGLISAPLEGAALSQLIARLKARGASTEQSAAVTGPTIVTTSEGKVLSGSLQVEGKAGMQKLEGVVRIGGHLGVEGILKNGDLLAMRDIKVVEGRLTFEGMRSKAPID